MRCCADGFKVDGAAALDRHGADRGLMVDDVARAYAQQMFVDGFCSADPHPANLLVHVPTLPPVRPPGWAGGAPRGGVVVGRGRLWGGGARAGGVAAGALACRPAEGV